MRSTAPSTRKMRRAHARYGDAVFAGPVGKHSGGRSPSPKVKPPKDRSALVARGLRLIRDLWLRVGILTSPLEEHELRTVLEKAKEEFDSKGMVSINTSLILHAAGYEVERLEHLWGLMKTAEVDMNGIDNHPDWNTELNDEEDNESSHDTPAP